MMRYILFLAVLLCVASSADAYDSDSTSSALTGNAALSLKKEDWRAVKYYTQRCITLYRTHALKMQRKLKDYPPLETSQQYWALNDVAYAYFLQGEMYRMTGKIEKAKKMYVMVVEKFFFAQKYDPSLGGDWKVAEACQEQLDEIMPELQKFKSQERFIKKDLKPLKQS